MNCSADTTNDHDWFLSENVCVSVLARTAIHGMIVSITGVCVLIVLVVAFLSKQSIWQTLQTFRSVKPPHGSHVIRVGSSVSDQTLPNEAPTSPAAAPVSASVDQAARHKLLILLGSFAYVGGCFVVAALQLSLGFHQRRVAQAVMLGIAQSGAGVACIEVCLLWIKGMPRSSFALGWQTFILNRLALIRYSLHILLDLAMFITALTTLTYAETDEWVLVPHFIAWIDAMIVLGLFVYPACAHIKRHLKPLVEMQAKLGQGSELQAALRRVWAAEFATSGVVPGTTMNLLLILHHFFREHLVPLLLPCVFFLGTFFFTAMTVVFRFK